MPLFASEPRLNAEQGTDYDVMKFLNWTFEGKSAQPRWMGSFGWQLGQL